MTQTSQAGWYRRLVLQKPRVVLAVLVLALVFFGYQSQHFRLDASADALLLEDDQDLQTFRETQARYRSQDLLLVTFTPEADLFSDPVLDRLQALNDELAKIPSVDSVFTLLDVPLLTSTDMKLTEMGDDVPTLRTARDQVDRKRARAEISSSAVFQDLILSTDGRTTALLLNLHDDAESTRLLKARESLRQQARKQALGEAEAARLESVTNSYDGARERANAALHEDITRIRAILEKYGGDAQLHLGGVPMIVDDMIVFIGNDLVTFGTGVLAFIVATLGLLFRRLRWVLLPVASCFFAGVVMVGILGFANWKVTVISSNFISLMLIITMSMNMHLIVRFRQLRADIPDASHLDLIQMTAARMVRPCLYTALTTILGFSSLVFSGIKPVMDFGWMMSLGLVVTFLTSFLLFPALLVLVGPGKDEGKADGPVAVTHAFARFTIRHGGLVLAISLVLAVLSGIGISRLQVENSFVNYFRDSTEIYQGMKLIDEQLGGTTPVDILLDLSEESSNEDDECADFSKLTEDQKLDCEDLGYGPQEGNPEDYWFTSFRVDRIKAVHDYLDRLPEVGKVLSLASVLRVGESINEGKPFTPFELAILYKRIPADLRASMISPYISLEEDEARVALRILDSKPDLRRDALLKKIRHDLQHEVGLEPERFTVSGILVLYNNMLQSLFHSQILTLGVVMLGIALMFMMLFRSVKLAIIGIVPNVLAAGTVLGLMGLAGIPLDMMTITIAAITIGIAVDNAIHYIYRFREEYPRIGDYVKTMEVCHANIGRAVLYTSITIIFGFSILVFSNFIPTIYFGLLTAVAMGAALIAALTLLPKLILMVRPF